MGNCYEAQTVEGKWKSVRKDSRVFIPGHVYSERNNAENWKGEKGGEATYRIEGNSDGSGVERVSFKEKMKEPVSDSAVTGKMLIIAEKPSVGRAISQALGTGEKGDTFQNRKEGYI